MEIILIVLMILFIFIGYFYVKESANKTETFDSNEQEYIKKNRELYGVSNKGTSLDNKEIYTIDISKLGL